MKRKEKLQIEVEVPSKKIHVEHVYCPKGHSLCDTSRKIHGYPAIKVKAKFKDQEGILYIDPVFGSYNNVEENITIPKGGVVEFFCPECGISLRDQEISCQLCASPMFVFHLPKGGIVEGCMKKGCLYHRMKIVDAEQQISRLFENDTLESYL
jgi:hypothetical protein